MKTHPFVRLWPHITTPEKYIDSLTTSEDVLLTYHEQKAGFLWNAFKERLGASNFQGISYNLESLLQRQDLDHMDNDFSHTEITEMTKELPNSHAPGPDGFNGLFIKKMLAHHTKCFLQIDQGLL